MLGSSDYSDPDTIRQLIGPSLPMPTFSSPSQVQKLAGELRSRILSSYTTLGDILSRHEASIQKRWTKKTKQQRLKVLLECWPSMPKRHRPDFDAFRNQSDQNRRGTRHRDNFMWPYINHDDLCTPRSLLLLLNSRGRHHPCHFCAADIEAMHLGLVTGSVVPTFLNQHVMLLNGIQDDSYGKLISWDDHPEAFNWMSDQKQFLPGEGLLVLEAQERVLRFLVDCCQAMFHDIPPSKLLSDDYPVQPEPQQSTVANVDGFESQAVMAEEEPYRLPAKLDLERMSSLLQAQADAAKDHTWALREDPSYFLDELNEITQHRQEMMKDSNGHAHPVLVPSRIDIFLGRVVRNLLDEVYSDFEIFVELHNQVSDLIRFHDKCESIDIGQDLPSDYLDAILLLRYHLQQATKRLQKKLQHSGPASPLWKKHFVRVPPPNPTTSMIKLVEKPGSSRSEAENYLLYLFNILWSDTKELWFIRFPLLMDELDRQLQVPALRNLLSSRVANLIGSLSIIAQCLRQLDQYYPWARRFENLSQLNAADLDLQYAQWREPLAGILKAFHNDTTFELSRLSDNPTKRFYYPVDKRRTKDNVDALRQAESKLDDFWDAADASVLHGGGSFDGTAFEMMRRGRTLQRTYPWSEPPPKEKPDLAAVQKSLADDFGFRSSSPPPPTTAVPKVKTKTRGVARDGETEATAPQPHPEPPAATRIPVDAKSLKTFRNLFFTPGTSSTPGEVPWRDFVRAMTCTGMRAEKLYGSVWVFTGGGGPIQFHEPHPHNKLGFWVGRRYGRRLGRAFGWDAGTFVLENGG